MIWGWTPTEFATVGNPAAPYWRTFSPHFPRLHRSSGTHETPMSAPAMAVASPCSLHGTDSTGSGSNRGNKRSGATF